MLGIWEKLNFQVKFQLMVMQAYVAIRKTSGASFAKTRLKELKIVIGMFSLIIFMPECVSLFRSFKILPLIISFHLFREFETVSKKC